MNAEVFCDELCAFLFFSYQRRFAVEARGGFIGELGFPPLEMAGKKGWERKVRKEHLDLRRCWEVMGFAEEGCFPRTAPAPPGTGGGASPPLANPQPKKYIYGVHPLVRPPK